LSLHNDSLFHGEKSRTEDGMKFDKERNRERKSAPLSAPLPAIRKSLSEMFEDMRMEEPRYYWRIRYMDKSFMDALKETMKDIERETR
jgi:hypothetical protein